jgi:GT2 family glycosyltransferase
MREPDDGRYGVADEVFGPCAGAALYRKKMLDEVGLFDEDFFAYMEDVDLALRGQMAGWKCMYAPGAIVCHFHGGTAGYMSDFSIYYGNRNILWNVLKNFPAPLLITSLPWICGRNLATIPYYIFKGHGVAILRAKIDAVKGVPQMVSRRRRLPGGSRRIRAFMKTWAEIPGTNNVK